MFDRLAGALNMPLAVVSFEHTCDCLIIIAYPHILFANVSFSIKTIKLFQGAMAELTVDHRINYLFYDQQSVRPWHLVDHDLFSFKLFTY